MATSLPNTTAQKQLLDEMMEQRAHLGWNDVHQELNKKTLKPLLDEFDPLSEHYVPDAAPALRAVPDWLAAPDYIPEYEENGRQVKRWRFLSGLNESLVPKIIEKIHGQVQHRFKINYSYYNVLKNIETNKTFPWLQEGMKSRFFNTIAEAETWLRPQEENRLDAERIERPDTKSVFHRFMSVQIKIILDNQPLQVGAGRLPDWLRKKKGIFALDVFNDNLCVFRCLAVHRGAHKQHNLRQTRRMAKDFFSEYEIPNENVEFQHIPQIAQYFKQKIVVYEVSQEGVFGLRGSFTSEQEEYQPMTIGLYNNHAFLITDLEKATNLYKCAHCGARFTQSVSLLRHAERCTNGQTKVQCPGGRVWAPDSLYERAFHPRGKFGKKACYWIEHMSKQRGIHIHYHLCGHGGERVIAGHPVDGYHPESKTVYQFHGCHFHGCPECYPSEEDRKTVVCVEKGVSITREKAYQRTLQRNAAIKAAGYKLVVRWEHERPQLWNNYLPRKQNTTFPHAIVFDFESWLNTAKREVPTAFLTYESEHVPVSVSLADTLDREPEHIVEKDPKVLVRKFWESLVRRGAVLREEMKQKYLPEDILLLPKKQQALIRDWCEQIPVVGFNTGKYDLNLIKKYFVTHIGTENQVTIAKKQGKIMFINTPNFKFLDIMNYLSPGTSYEDWVKTYGSLAKSWLPYEWFTSVDKLDDEGLPPYRCWFSKLKNKFVLSPEEYEECQCVFREKGMKTFGDWLRYYNNLDVGPFLEALEKMRGFYSALGVDIFKDAVSLPGVSLKYLLRGTLRKYDAPELYAPDKEAYDLLKSAVVGGPSLVFTRKHEVGNTAIRSHKYENARTCQRVLGYDANALYPSTMLQEMPTGKEKVVAYAREEVANFVTRLREKKWFGFAEVDISVPRELWEKFEEFPPLFYNSSIPNKAIPEHMKKYLRKTGRTELRNQNKLMGRLSGEKLLLYTPLLEWYLDHGLEITAVYRTIDYEREQIFVWFVNQVTENRRKGDENPDKALLAEVFKLLGNSAYGKLIEALERQTRVIYTKNQNTVDKAKRSVWFDDMEEIEDVFELEFRKEKVTIDRPFQVGIVVYQLAKLRMLQFYYDCLDHFIDRRDFELIQMDTDSLYLGLSCETLEEAVRPELRNEFEATKKNWFAWDKWSKREPGIFKLEFEGNRGIALCSKCYYMENEAENKVKVSSKGVSQRQNQLDWKRYEAALNGSVDKATNRGFRMLKGTMRTYEQKKLGLSAYYDKRWVLPDGIHTEPIEYHL